MKNMVIAISLLLFSNPAFSAGTNYRLTDKSLNDFSAPVVSTTPSTTDNPLGSIAFDAVNDRFIGLFSSGWNDIGQSGLTAPTIQKFTSSSGTYTTPTNPSPLYIRVRMVGGGGGGGGSSTSAANNGGTGGTGGATTFGTSLLTSNGGSGGSGTSQVSGGVGGSATISAPAYGTALTGSQGDSSQESNTAGVNLGGRMGGATMFGGGGSGGSSVSTGNSPATNTGAGGGGAGAPSAGIAGSGGGGGGYVDAIIPNPSATYSYAVGAAGTFGNNGTSGTDGGDGAIGYIEVTEYYQ